MNGFLVSKRRYVSFVVSKRQHPEDPDYTYTFWEPVKVFKTKDAAGHFMDEQDTVTEWKCRPIDCEGF